MVAPDREITDWRATWVHCSSSAFNIYLCATLLTFGFLKSLVDFSAAPPARHGARTREQYLSENLVLERLTERGMNTYRANYFIAWFYVFGVLFLAVMDSCCRPALQGSLTQSRQSRYSRTFHKGCRHRRASIEECQRLPIAEMSADLVPRGGDLELAENATKVLLKVHVIGI